MTVVEDGLEFTLSDHGTKLTVAMPAPDAFSDPNIGTVIVFPDLHSATITKGDEVWNLRGADITKALQDKQMVRVGANMLHLDPGVSVTFSIVPQSGGTLVIDDSVYGRSDEDLAFAQRHRYRIWHGTVRLRCP